MIQAGATRKIGKGEANYQYKPKQFQRCGNCSMFVKPSSCTLVSGDISFHGWCKYWERKK